MSSGETTPGRSPEPRVGSAASPSARDPVPRHVRRGRIGRLRRPVAPDVPTDDRDAPVRPSGAARATNEGLGTAAAPTRAVTAPRPRRSLERRSGPAVARRRQLTVSVPVIPGWIVHVNGYWPGLGTVTGTSSNAPALTIACVLRVDALERQVVWHRRDVPEQQLEARARSPSACDGSNLNAPPVSVSTQDIVRGQRCRRR